MSKFRIAFFIRLKNNKNCLANADLDCGNPGVGGTQYLFLLTVKYLNRFYGNNYALLLTDTDIELNDIEIPISFVNDENKAIDVCENESIDVLVFNTNILDYLPSKLTHTKIRVFLWAHNTLNGKRQRAASALNSVERIICVSKKQYENMQDTCCFNKCTYISNVIPKAFYDNSSLTDYSELKAIYVGCIMPQKGIHNLIEIWRYVEKKVPEAQLYIFGGANIWNQNAMLGSIGAADMYYDRVIQRRLDKLEHPENIHFMGAKSWKEIDKMIVTTRVGIVNPSYYMRDETFCLSAVEMESHGITVVSRQRYDGLSSTIQHCETGFLEQHNKDIANRIVDLLTDKSLCSKMGEAAREASSEFIVDKEIHKWYDLINNNISCTERRKPLIVSKDTRLLWHDFILRIFFLLESRKVFDLISHRLKGGK